MIFTYFIKMFVLCLIQMEICTVTHDDSLLTNRQTFLASSNVASFTHTPVAPRQIITVGVHVTLVRIRFALVIICEAQIIQ